MTSRGRSCSHVQQEAQIPLNEHLANPLPRPPSSSQPPTPLAVVRILSSQSLFTVFYEKAVYRRASEDVYLSEFLQEHLTSKSLLGNLDSLYGRVI